MYTLKLNIKINNYWYEVEIEHKDNNFIATIDIGEQSPYIYATGYGSSIESAISSLVACVESKNG